ncbi:MAG: zinc ribbon domain-containing protein [Anaerolineae bacterium]
MTKKSLGHVELEWTCPNCGTRNRGTEAKCTSCAAPQPADIRFEQAAEEKFITDEVKLKQAAAGPDVHCAFCGTRNPADATNCSQCGADLSEAAARGQGRVLGAHRDEPAPEIPCPYCGTLNTPTALACSQCGGALKEPAAEQSETAVTAPKRRNILPYIIVGALVLIVVVFGILSSRTEDMTGRVQTVNWTRTVGILELQPVKHEEWRDQIPAEAVLGACTERVRSVEDQPVPNSVEVCGTPYTVDEGTGLGEVVQDCEYQVYDDWCAYTVDEWVEVDQVSASGNDINPHWPNPALAAGQREGSKQEHYEIVFDVDGDNYTYDTSDADVFVQCEIGSEWLLKVNTFNSVLAIEPNP